MTTTTALEVTVEAQGSQPNFRQDIIQPLLRGRVPVEGVSFKFTGPHDSAGFTENKKFQEGDFGLLDTNMGDVFPAINAGWNIKLLPAFTKRKPVWNYVWVRADRGINSPKDLEGKTFGTSGWGVVTVWTRGLLATQYGVDISKISWVAGGAGRWELYKEVKVVYPNDRKRQEQRLLDGEVDACTGDITDAKSWDALESSPDKVKRLFPNYQEVHKQLWTQQGIVTPAHVWVIGGKFIKDNPGIDRKLFDAIEQSREIAYNDALGDGTTYSLVMAGREAFKQQMKDWGDIHKHGFKATKNTFDKLLEFYHEQGQTKQRLTYEQVIAPGTLDT